jgi:hypothetical protein
MDLFETATRRNYRFPSAKGTLTVQQLWQLPLINKTPTRAPASAAWSAVEHPAMPPPTIATSARWWPASGLSLSGVPAPAL